MKSKAGIFLLGVLITAGSFLAYINLQPKESYTPTYVLNEETGTSARSMEAEIVYFDTDGDGDEENVLIYSCEGCNAPPREIAIIDDGELVFFYEGGNLQFIPVEPGLFIVDESNVPRDGRRIETQYSYDLASSTYKVVETLQKRP